VRQPGNDPLNLFALCRILDRSGDGFKISKKALSFVVHDTDGPIRRLFATIAVNVSPQCHKKIPPSPVGSGIVRFGRVHWASRRRNLAEINVTLTALALRSIFRASLEVFENGRFRTGRQNVTPARRFKLATWQKGKLTFWQAIQSYNKLPVSSLGDKQK
jgi:hypothetical protein